jgi:hypothetical protein
MTEVSPFAARFRSIDGTHEVIHVIGNETAPGAGRLSRFPIAAVRGKLRCGAHQQIAGSSRDS